MDSPDPLDALPDSPMHLPMSMDSQQPLSPAAVQADSFAGGAHAMAAMASIRLSDSEGGEAPPAGAAAGLAAAWCRRWWLRS
jgi:hypothetical protein